MKKLLESWKRAIKEVEVLDLPTTANLKDVYIDYLDAMDEAVKQLNRIKVVQEFRNFHMDELNNLIKAVEVSRDDENLRYDIEGEATDG